MPHKEELAEIVGIESLVVQPDELLRYAKDHSFVQQATPQYVVRAKNTEQIQKIVRWANEKGRPLTPVSSGEPHFRGDTIPLFGGVILDLSQMNRIVRVNERERVVMIEPGVTFTQLQPDLEKVGLRLPMPLCPRSSKSVVGSCLEREPHTIPKYHMDMSEPLLCVEVIFGTGDILKTGEAAGPGTIEEQWKKGRSQKLPSGPGQIGFSKLIQGSQGSVGIVTWASVRCEVLPKVHKLLFIPVQRIEDLIDFVYQILRLRLGDECLLLNSLNFASLLGNGGDINWLKKGLPPWTLLLGIAGYEIFPEERVEYQEKDIADVAHQSGLSPVTTISGISGDKVLGLLVKSSPEPYWKLKYKGECHDIFFLTTLDKVPKFIDTMHRLAEAHQYSVADMGIYIQPIQQGSSCHCEFNLTCNPADSREVNKVRGLFLEASETLMMEGGFFSRPYGPWAEMAYNRDAASRDAVRKIKGIFDPNNILNPGKLG
ncbi:FAD-binding oxidoreductase [Chloroflexota bacterium]